MERMLSQNEIKKKVEDFNRHYLKGRDASYQNLIDALGELGFSIIPFEQSDTDSDLRTIIDSLGICKFISEEKAFTYVSSEYRLVFIHEGLSNEEKLIVLAHEMGHIICEHFGHKNIIGIDQREEHEANEFAHFLLYPSNVTIMSRWLRRNASLYISILVILIVSCALVFKLACDNKYSDYYVTEKGTKYHIRSCYVIADKNNVRRLSEEEINSGKYEPCNICIQNE